MASAESPLLFGAAGGAGSSASPGGPEGMGRLRVTSVRPSPEVTAARARVGHPMAMTPKESTAAEVMLSFNGRPGTPMASGAAPCGSKSVGSPPPRPHPHSAPRPQISVGPSNQYSKAIRKSLSASPKRKLEASGFLPPSRAAPMGYAFVNTRQTEMPMQHFAKRQRSSRSPLSRRISVVWASIQMQAASPAIMF